MGLHSQKKTWENIINCCKRRSLDYIPIFLRRKKLTQYFKSKACTLKSRCCSARL